MHNFPIVNNHILAKQENEWREALLNKPKLRTHITFKTNFYTEKYVKKYTCKRARSMFAQLRIGILRLEIETGRYRGIAIEERLCRFSKSLVEDEVHFLCICPLYVAERFKLYTSIIEINELFEPINTKFQYLKQLNSTDVLRFVDKAWNICKEFMYN